jgi:hypothetical protein
MNKKQPNLTTDESKLTGRSLDDMRIHYNPSRFTIYTSPLVPDEDDDFRESRSTSATLAQGIRWP